MGEIVKLLAQEIEVQPFPVAKAPLPQARVFLDGQIPGGGHGGGGFAGAAQVAAPNLGDGGIGQQAGQTLRLRAAPGVEGNIGLALGAALAVPVRFPVPGYPDSAACHATILPRTRPLFGYSRAS